MLLGCLFGKDENDILQLGQKVMLDIHRYTDSTANIISNLYYVY